MGRIVFAAWIPRSYVHVSEVKRKLNLLDFKVERVSFSDSGKFSFEYKGSRVDFCLNGNGLYTLSSNTSLSPEDFGKQMHEFMLERLIKTFHSVTYKQIKDESLPFNWCVLSFSGKQSVYDDIKPYSSGEVYHCKNLSEAGVEFALELLLFNRFMYSFMDRMEVLYHDADNVARMLEKAMELEELRKTVLKMDLIVKDVVESNTKVKQGTQIFSSVNAEFARAKLSSSDKKVLRDFGIYKLSEHLVKDFAYVSELWEMLIGFLEKIDSAAEARFSYQESVESNRIESLLSIDVAGQIAPILVSVFLINENGFNGLITSIGLLLIWFGLMKYMKKIKKAKKVEVSQSIKKV